MDDKTNAAPSTEPSEGVAVPVTVTRQDTSGPTGAPSVAPLETVEPPTDATPPPAPPSGPADDTIPPAPLSTQSFSNAPTAPIGGKSLDELLAAEEAKNPSFDPSSANTAKKSHKGTVILIVVLLALALIGGAVFAYIQTNKKVTPATTQANPVKTTQPTDAKANAADIDKTSNDLDASLKKVDDTKDYSANDLSDTTLGL